MPTTKLPKGTKDRLRLRPANATPKSPKLAANPAKQSRDDAVTNAFITAALALARDWQKSLTGDKAPKPTSKAGQFLKAYSLLNPKGLPEDDA